MTYYNTWFDFTIYCDDSNQDCLNCPIIKETHLKPYKPDVYGTCQVPKALDILKKRGVPKPERKKLTKTFKASKNTCKSGVVSNLDALGSWDFKRGGIA